MLLMGLALAGCSTSAPESTAETSGSAEVTTAATAPSAKPSEQAAATERKVAMHVEGAQSGALVKSLVVTADGKESGGEMTTQALPFDQEVSLPAESVFTKVLVLGKYASGATGEISCSISIDGVEVSSVTSNNHKPAECLFVENSSK